MVNKKVKYLSFLILLASINSNLFSQNYQLAWSDEFTLNKIDESIWTFETGGSGWGNEELQFYTNRDINAFIEDGKLIIQALKENYGGRNYTSSRLITQNKKLFKYGKIEARIKLPYGQGLWPAFWLLGQSFNSIGWPACGEIDIMEMIGGAGREKTAYGTAHWDNNGQHASYGGYYTLNSGTFADDFHTFSIEWTPNLIRWYVDGSQYHVVNITPSQLSEFQQNFFIILNVAVGGDWPGSPDATTSFPQRMEVDYVRVYQDESNFPKITISEPQNNSSYNEFDDIIINTQIDFDKSIEKVEFYQDNLQIGETYVEPFSIVWRNIHAGDYKIRAIAKSVDGNLGESETINVTVGGGAPKSPYSGYPINIPGIIEAEEFDIGINGIAYSDNSPTNTGFEFRKDEGVDIQLCSDDDNGYNIGWVETGEWISYTIEVSKTANYELTSRVASELSSGTFQIEIDNQLVTDIIQVPNSGGWQNWTSVVTNLNITEGLHEFRFVVKSGDFNLNRFEIYEPNTQPELNLIAPIGGETFEIGSVQEIMWDNLKVDNVTLGLSTNGGTSWSFIAKNIKAKFGSYRWLVPDDKSDNCLIMIIDSKSSAVNSVTKSNFVIDYTTSIAQGNQIPSEFELYQNYPNPFNPTTIVSFNIPVQKNVKLTLFDVLGKQIFTIVNDDLSPGFYNYEFDGSTLSNGVYFYKLEAGNYSKVLKMVLAK
ncbi:MAG: family 16 glycosylhydrolase [Melioribacteraceae bacterium]|nr:family 16 glycosylhydrolase [Melioribacteraceae bacterium]